MLPFKTVRVEENSLDFVALEYYRSGKYFHIAIQDCWHSSDLVTRLETYFNNVDNI